MHPTAEPILHALEKYTARRPGLDPRLYITPGDWRNGLRAYRAESRSVTRDRHDAEYLLRQVALSQITGAQLVEAARHAFAGRLEIRQTERGVELEYTAGQYEPTEYRAAVCAVLASALWYHHRDGLKPEPGQSAGDAIRAKFRRLYGRRIARRWFDS